LEKGAVLPLTLGERNLFKIGKKHISKNAKKEKADNIARLFLRHF
jgi:hypothetical protein